MNHPVFLPYHSQQNRRFCVQVGEGQSQAEGGARISAEAKHGQGTHEPSLTSPADFDIHFHDYEDLWFGCCDICATWCRESYRLEDEFDD